MIARSTRVGRFGLGVLRVSWPADAPTVELCRGAVARLSCYGFSCFILSLDSLSSRAVFRAVASNDFRVFDDTTPDVQRRQSSSHAPWQQHRMSMYFAEAEESTAV